ncbi:hypothetical protein [Lysinibacillus xylanilyticus]|uniref:hypothetical protein n=1 Tax=Lysinibacillus xylanilyticus TaxID=582475 RepID=UPI003D059DA0
MSKNKQRTGVFDLEDVINKIELKPLEDKQKEDIAPTIIAPKILVDATEIETTNNTIPIDRALLIVKEQMRLSGIRPRGVNCVLKRTFFRPAYVKCVLSWNTF